MAARLKRALRETLKPPPRFDVAEWADRYRVVSQKNSADPGQWRTDRQPCAVGLYKAVTEVDTNKATACCSTQILKTEWLLNIAGYFIHQDPASVLFIQPTQKLAEDFSKERFGPTRQSTPVLKELIQSSRARDSDTTIAHKDFPGGSLDFVGANAPADLASRPKRVVLSDEIDKYPASAGQEGDPLALGEERSSTFWNYFHARACSPTTVEGSAIWREYLASDQRKCFVGCPHCGHRQVMRWGDDTVIWDQDENGNHLPETARYHCVECGAGWTEAERKQALRDILNYSDHGWRQTKQFRCCGKDQAPSRWNAAGRSLCVECGEPSRYDGHAGFQASKLISTRQPLSALVKEFLNAGSSPELLKKWRNTGLAEPWEEKFEALDPRTLADRAEPYSAEAVPDGVRVVTCGVDTHDDRLEVQLVGWGDDEEAWVLKHDVLYGDTSEKHIWDVELDEYRSQKLITESGRRLSIRATCIDAGGHRASMVHAYCRNRKWQKCFAVIGRGNTAQVTRMIWPKTAGRTKNSGDSVYTVGVDTAKNELFGRMMIELQDVDQPQPYAVHFPAAGLTADWFDQLTAEKAVMKVTGTRSWRNWELKKKGSRNEALDCFVYALAARHSLATRLKQKPLNAVEPSVQDNASTSEVLEPSARPPRKRRERRNRSGWAAYD